MGSVSLNAAEVAEFLARNIFEVVENSITAEIHPSGWGRSKSKRIRGLTVTKESHDATMAIIDEIVGCQ